MTSLMDTDINYLWNRYSVRADKGIDGTPIMTKDEFTEACQEIVLDKHLHVNNGIDDACKQCGHDLRNLIHTRD